MLFIDYSSPPRSFPSSLFSLLSPPCSPAALRPPQSAAPCAAARARRGRHGGGGGAASAAPGGRGQGPSPGAQGLARRRGGLPGGVGGAGGGCAAPPPGAPRERGRGGGRRGIPRPGGAGGAGPTGGAAADLAPALPRVAALCPPLGLTRSPGSILARAAVRCLPGSAPALRCPRPRAAPRARRGPDLLTAAPGKVAAFSERRNNRLHCAKRAPCLFCFLNVRPHLRLFWLNFLVRFTRGVGFFFFFFPMCEACSLRPTLMLLLSGLYLFSFLLQPDCVELKALL